MVGRKKEIEELLSYKDSDRAEFVAVYGRRRVGKTYLVYQTFKNDLTFDVTGLYKRPMKEQIANFYTQLAAAGWKGTMRSSWKEAFDDLAQMIEKSRRKRKILFFDEMPWMDTKRSGFESALEHFWNSWASRRNDVMLIACGSATTWMMSKLINNRGGLHNRLTHQMHIRPFSLAETNALLCERHIHWQPEQVAICYMVMGGIPYYLSLLKPSLSLAQNIDQLFFEQSGEMTTEFGRLFSSLFEYADYYEKIVATLAKKMKGMTRSEIASATKISVGGNLSKALRNLENCCFIRRYNDYVHRGNNTVYQLIDPFCLFHYHFMASGEYHNSSGMWLSLQNTAKFASWAGFAFEMLCLMHIRQIKEALGIGAVATNVFSWRCEGAQIDLVIDRQDRIVNLCEIKFTSTQFVITKAYHTNLMNKLRLFRESTANIAPRRSLMLTFITANGVKKNAYSGEVSALVTLNQLMR